MTDTPSPMPLDAMANQDLVSRDAFEKEAVWLPAMAVQHWNAGKMSIEGKTFTDCLIEGPAVVAVMNNTTFDSCAMGTTTDTRNLLYRPMGQKLAGVVGMSNCTFVRCRFAQVGFTGSDGLLEQLQAGVTTLTSQLPGTAS
ncbi:hypothetical protein [Brevundimonas sp.]|jgi:hypothetical protein|uniref:hypothetical protein n=1 Tax=Brevundimonas sp. TaxID=1871086 RepID=UPI0025B9B1FD|nr:hypothetical protein [Brevundimonas sp.]